jgi:hypothetical protein
MSLQWKELVSKNCYRIWIIHYRVVLQEYLWVTHIQGRLSYYIVEHRLKLAEAVNSVYEQHVIWLPAQQPTGPHTNVALQEAIVLARSYPDCFEKINNSLANYRAAVQAGDPAAMEEALEGLNRARQQRENLDHQIQNIVPENERYADAEED